MEGRGALRCLETKLELNTETVWKVCPSSVFTTVGYICTWTAQTYPQLVSGGSGNLALIISRYSGHEKRCAFYCKCNNALTSYSPPFFPCTVLIYICADLSKFKNKAEAELNWNASWHCILICFYFTNAKQNRNMPNIGVVLS